uniref:C2H2-type domain-containing protein n=1 Tax=Gadus morhua TaxID=8049 RepID=A0A8C5C9R9_GADMO
METGKAQSVSALLYGSVAVPTERKMDAPAPLTAVYIRAVPAPLPTQQLFPQAQFPGTPQREPATLNLAGPPLYTKDALPFLTVHLSGGLQPLHQELGLSPTAPLAPLAPASRPRAAGKHVCPHCGRDCMKPSVLEKHLRCHTGERPYPCLTCRVSFKTQSNLYKHKRTQAHARLSAEAGQGASGSLESGCGSSLGGSSLDSQVEEESGGLEEEVNKYSYAARAEPGADPERGPTGDPVQGTIDTSFATQKPEPAQRPGLAKEEVRGKECETRKCQSVTPNRHLPLQRQAATQVFKEWPGEASRGKAQSHTSTDSGFSESTDHNMDALPECITGHHDWSGSSQNGPDPRDGVPVREQRSLEEHISKLISENSVVVDDKKLKTMRPRKTVLSKQGSIDLPLPYTYKDSFHFDMRNNLSPIARLPGSRRPELQSSLQPPGSASTEQAPLSRSSSLPYSIALLPPEQGNRSFSYPRDDVTVIRRGSSNPVHPTAFPCKSVDQQVPAHRPLVRQAAVDCNHAAEGPFFTHSSAERLPVNRDLSCDGGGGGEPSDRKRPRKKAQKFTYNKWYTYKGGTFKKLYNTTKAGCRVVSAAEDPSSSRPERLMAQSGKSPSDWTTTAGLTTGGVAVCHTSCLPAQPPPVPGLEFNPKPRRVHQECSSPRPPLLSHASLSTLHVTPNRSPENQSRTDVTGRPAERHAGKEKHAHSISPPQRAHIPSDRKKQRTHDSTVVNPSRTAADHNTINNPSSSLLDVFPTQNTNICQVSLRLDQRLNRLGIGLVAPCIGASNVQTSVKPHSSVSLLSSAKPSFLPKYQLKIPTTTETRSTPSLHTVKVSKKQNVDYGLTGVSSTSDHPHFLPSSGNTTSSGSEFTPQPYVHSGYPQSTEARNSTQTENVCESFVPGGTPWGRPARALTQRHCTTITTATATMRSHPKELCSPTVIQASAFKPVMAPHAACLARPLLPNRSITASTTARPNSRSAILSSSTSTTLTNFSQGPRLDPPLLDPLRSLPSLGQSTRGDAGSGGHPLAEPPRQMGPFEAGQLDPFRTVFHVQTADLQICLQIISDEQLALIEPRVKKQAGTSEKTPQTPAPRLIGPAETCRGKRAHQSTCDQREVENIAPPPSDLQSVILNSMGQAGVSQSPASGIVDVSRSLQPLVHPNSDSNHNTAAESRCGTGRTEASPKAAKPDTRILKGEPAHSVSAGLNAAELGEVTSLLPGGFIQEGSQASQHTPLSRRAITCTVEEVTATLKDRPSASQGRDGGAWAWTQAEASHVAPHPWDGASLLPEVNNECCRASAELFRHGEAGHGPAGPLIPSTPPHRGPAGPLIPSTPPHRGPAGPLIPSTPPHRGAVWDSAASLADLPQPQPPGPSHGGPSHGGPPPAGGLTNQKAPESRRGRSSPGLPDSVGAAAERNSQGGAREMDQQSVEVSRGGWGGHGQTRKIQVEEVGGGNPRQLQGGDF